MLSTSNKQARALRTNKRQLRHLACHKLNVYVNIKIRLFMKFAKTLLPGNNFPEGGFPDLASASRSWGWLWDSRIEDREALGQKHRWLQQVEMWNTLWQIAFREKTSSIQKLTHHSKLKKRISFVLRHCQGNILSRDSWHPTLFGATLFNAQFPLF